MVSKISARNMVEGKVTKITKGEVMTRVEIEISKGPTVLSSVITTDAASDLDIKEGDLVTAIIKSTEVMIGK